MNNYELVINRAQELAPMLEKSLKISGHKVLVDVKTLSSLKRKCEKTGRLPNEIGDVLRAAVLVRNSCPIILTIKQLRKYFRQQIIKIDEKKGTSGNLYRGAVHLDIMFHGMKVEVQVMSMSMWAYKNEAHKQYEKLREGQDIKQKDWFGVCLSKIEYAKHMKAIKRGNYNKYKVGVIE